MHQSNQNGIFQRKLNCTKRFSIVSNRIESNYKENTMRTTQCVHASTAHFNGLLSTKDTCASAIRGIRWMQHMSTLFKHNNFCCSTIRAMLVFSFGVFSILFQSENKNNLHFFRFCCVYLFFLKKKLASPAHTSLSTFTFAYCILSYHPFYSHTTISSKRTLHLRNFNTFFCVWSYFELLANITQTITIIIAAHIDSSSSNPILVFISCIAQMHNFSSNIQPYTRTQAHCPHTTN